MRASTTGRCPATRASAAASASAATRAVRARGSASSSSSALLAFGLLLGLAATASFIDHLPKLSHLGPVELGENSSVYARDCTRKPCQDEALGVIARTENRVSVRWKEIAPTMRSATVAIEDKRYWEHGALDWHGIARAALNNLQAGGITQGGSTISQQLAKNLYLQREASSRSFSRKIDEAWIAVQLEDKYTKAEILTAYLNTVFYGESAYGVEAAAHTFFDKTAKQLTLPAVGAPGRAAAGAERATTRSSTRRQRIEAPRRGAARACATCAGSAPPPTRRRSMRRSELKRGSYGTPSSSPFVFDQVRQELNARLPAKLAARGGLRVYSTVDQRLQFAGRRAIKDVLKTPGRSLGRARRDQRAQRQRAGARHLRLRLGQEPVQPGDRRAPLAGLDVQALRARRRAAPRRRPVDASTTRPATSRSPRTTPSARSRAAGRRTTPTAAAGAT